MRDKVILGITLTVVLLLTLLIYMGVDAQRGPSTTEAAREAAIGNGRHIYAQYCVQCHGPKGEGCVGPALNRDAWRAVKDGAPNPAYDPDSHTLIYRTVTRGRVSNQPGEQMPPWALAEGGSLNDQEIEDVITFIYYGDWDSTLNDTPSATNLDKELPTYENTNYSGDVAAVRQLMLSKGCLNCHQVGSVGGRIAADLTDVGSRRTADWLRRWIQNPAAMPASERGPNLWLVAPTPGLYTPAPSGSPTATAVQFPMNTTFMPQIKMTDQELNLLVDYLAHARTSK
jgi:mono/diheme cytochrome c family protein